LIGQRPTKARAIAAISAPVLAKVMNGRSGYPGKMRVENPSSQLADI
jgi:hypothetical protein